MKKTIFCLSDRKDVSGVCRLGFEEMRSLLGGKGAGLFEMSRLGLPVPPGFTISTDVCRAYYERKEQGRRPLARAVVGEFVDCMAKLEKASGRRLGEPADPLLVSVRSGSKFSMPGMMDTILNLGLNDATVRGLEAQTRDPRFAWDCYRRFIAMFGSVVKGIGKDRFENALRDVKSRANVREDSELSTERLQRLAAVFKEIYREHAGSDFPEDPWDQLRLAVRAVFESWNNPRAIAYRKLNRIPGDLGTACTVQAMVFGNMGEDSATGVGFTRDPNTGEARFFGEYLLNAQGEDVVAGIRTPRPLRELRSSMPEVFGELASVSQSLERHFADVQDLEFTVERGRLFMLQTRTAKRSAIAALRCAVDMVKERLITPEQAVYRLTPSQLEELLRPVFDARALQNARLIARGLPAGPGAASGRIALSAGGAERLSRKGPVILVRSETSPDDIQGMIAADGILTATGGLTSHAAVVGRGLGKVCVVGCGSLDPSRLKEGDFISLDGFRGDVFEGRVPTRPSEILEVLTGERDARECELFLYYKAFMGWVDGFRRLGVRANADTPADVKAALSLGASGIGLCRTEHMFFRGDRAAKMFAVIAAEDDGERRKALEALFPLQKKDFVEIFRAMNGLPVTIRTIDPPLHEFLPRTRAQAVALCANLGFSIDKIWAKTLELKEQNPMLGHRGCRLGVTHPEITEMQVRAIIEAACDLKQEGVQASPEIMIPLVGHAAELRHQRTCAIAAAEETMVRRGLRVPYSIGTMIEVPRAALTAAEIAREADFFSFGTNDLTQMTLGYSRDDYGRYITKYLDLKILSDDPFATLDQGGVGRLVEEGVRGGRSAKPGLKIGVCGEHGGDPRSIAFFDAAGLDYVSCSPYRVPIARLAAAQAALKARRN